jgi:PTS system galactitol-specific IIA component
MDMPVRHQEAPVIISEDLVLIGLSATDSKQVIRALGRLLGQAGLVNNGFVEATVLREESFPTGLPAAIPVAIPHPDSSHSRQNAIAVATLLEPVQFGAMGERGRTLDVELVFLIAVAKKDDQVPWVVRLVEFFKSEDLLLRLRQADSPQLAVQILRSALLHPNVGSSGTGPQPRAVVEEPGGP